MGGDCLTKLAWQAVEAERKIKLLEDKTRKLEADYGAIMIKYGSLDAELMAAKASMQAHLEERCKLQGELLDSERKIGRMNQELFAVRGAGLSQVLYPSSTPPPGCCCRSAGCCAGMVLRA